MLKAKDQFINNKFDKTIPLNKNQFALRLRRFIYYINQYKILRVKDKKNLADIHPKQVNFDLLTIFYTVATLGSFTAAAKRLRLTQPAISIALRKIEKEMGFLVIKQAVNERSFLLTPNGLILFNYIQRFFQVIEESKNVSNLKASQANLKNFNSLSTHHKTKSIQFFIKPPLTNLFSKKEFFETLKINANFYENTSRFLILKSKGNSLYRSYSLKSKKGKSFIFDKTLSFENYKQRFYNKSEDFIEIHTVDALVTSFDLKISNCIYWG